MTRSVQHGTFVIEAKWFGGPPGVWQELERRMDFRVGGTESARGRFATTGRVSDFQAHYQDIVPDRRIVYSYNMHVDEKKISVGSREKGTRGLMDRLENSL